MIRNLHGNWPKRLLLPHTLSDLNYSSNFDESCETLMSSFKFLHRLELSGWWMDFSKIDDNILESSLVNLEELELHGAFNISHLQFGVVKNLKKFALYIVQHPIPPHYITTLNHPGLEDLTISAPFDRCFLDSISTFRLPKTTRLEIDLYSRKKISIVLPVFIKVLPALKTLVWKSGLSSDIFNDLYQPIQLETFLSNRLLGYAAPKARIDFNPIKRKINSLKTLKIARDHVLLGLGGNLMLDLDELCIMNSRVFLEDFHILPNLKRLVLTNCTFEHTEHIQETLAYFPNLELLDINNNGWRLRKFKEMPRLKKLNVIGNILEDLDIFCALFNLENLKYGIGYIPMPIHSNQPKISINLTPLKKLRQLLVTSWPMSINQEQYSHVENVSLP